MPTPHPDLDGYLDKEVRAYNRRNDIEPDVPEDPRYDGDCAKCQDPCRRFTDADYFMIVKELWG